MRELRGGDSASLSLAPLRVALSGVAPGSGVELRIHESGTPAQVFWQSKIEAVIPPTPRTVTVSVEGVDGSLIPPGTRLGVIMRSDLGGDDDQIVILPEDVGAKRVVDFAVVTIEGPSITIAVADRIGARAPVASEPGGSGLGWSGPGVYAFREAFASEVPDSSMPWVLALDGSVSMVRSLGSGDVASLVTVTAGICQEWMNRAPKSVLLSGPRAPVTISPGPSYPDDLLRAVQTSDAPASWFHLRPLLETASTVLRSGGVVVVVADGVPSDTDRARAFLEEHPNLDLRLVIRASSALGLPSNPAPEWYADELALLADLAPLATIIGVDDVAGPRRDVELAGALAGSGSRRVFG